MSQQIELMVSYTNFKEKYFPMLKKGDTIEGAINFSPIKSINKATNPINILKNKDNYSLTAKIIKLSHKLCIIDFGLLAFQDENLHHKNIKEEDIIEGNFYLNFSEKSPRTQKIEEETDLVITYKMKIDKIFDDFGDEIETLTDNFATHYRLIISII